MMSTTETLERRRQRDVVSAYGMGRHAGALAAGAWLSRRGLMVRPHAPWEVTIALDVVDEKAPASFPDDVATRFHVAIGSTEWGFYFCHQGCSSWIRVTELPFVHERDDFALLAKVPPLRVLGGLVRALEERHRIRFRREHAAIRSTIENAEPAIWEGVLADL
jgi:hypothetical protein